MKKKHAHVCGVGGVGMSALAQTLIATGYRVSGSDRFFDQGSNMPFFEKLRKAGVELVPQNGCGIRKETELVAFSTAIEENNPDIVKARALNKEPVHRAAALAKLVCGKTCVAIAGTSGKTTTTGMTGWILDYAGLDPFVVNGGAVLNWKSENTTGNIRVGKSGIWVLEVDESDKSLLEFHPEWSLITNMSKDHFNLAETRALFRQFAGQTKRGVVGCFGTPSRKTILENFTPVKKGFKVEFNYKGVRFSVPQMGAHNAENAVMAATICEKLGVPLETASRALRLFKGIERRLELIGTAKGITVIDDYAHNPAKITAAWQTVAGHYRGISGIWRPHGYGPLLAMMKDLVSAFSGQMRSTDRLYLLPVFDAGGTAKRNIQSDLLADLLRKKNIKAKYVETYGELEPLLRKNAKPGDAILTMGARDPNIPVFARKLLR